jgi:DNA polymerase I
MSSSIVTNSAKANNPKPLLILLDGHSLAFRAYYALGNSSRGPLLTSTGIPTSICFGFLNSLMQLLDIESPQYMAIAFDLAQPTFRHEADTNYKSDRTETPEEFIVDMLNLQQLLAAFNLTIATQPGYEADDLLGTIAIKASQEGYRVKIVSGDRDLFQLVDDQGDISVLYLHNQTFKKTAQNYTEFDRAKVIEKMGVTPEQIVDYKALCGDKSDCIPGVKGIGDKTAVKLLTEYPTLEEVYDNLEKITGATKKKLEAGREDALHSRFLAQINLDSPIQVDLAQYKLIGFEEDEVLPLLKQLELKKAISNLKRLQLKLGDETEIKVTNIEAKSKKRESGNGQLSLFSANNITEPTDKSVELFVPQLNTQIIDTEAKLKQLLKTLKQQTDINQPVAWDTETTSLATHSAELVGIGCCWGKRDSDIAYIPLGHLAGKQLDKALVLSNLKPILEDSQYPKALQNAKFDRLVLYHQGIKLSGVVFDTMLASYVLNPELTHNLGDLSERHGLGITAKSYQDLGITKGQTIANLDIAVAADYCGLDCYATYYLVGKLKTELSKFPQLEKLLLEVEQPLEPVLATIENTGISLDVEYLKHFSQKLDADLQKLEQDTYEAAGEKFNLSSPKQLGVILFDKLGLELKKSRKTKTGYSTNQQVLEKLRGDHPVIDHMLAYRTLAKLKSTYVDALPAMVRKSTNRVHTDFNQTVVATGRLSSSNPIYKIFPSVQNFLAKSDRLLFLKMVGY